MIFSVFYLKKKKKFLYLKNPIRATIYGLDWKLDLLKNNIEKENYDLINYLRDEWNHKVVGGNSTTHRVVHFSYDFGNIIHGLELKNFDKNKHLVIDLEYDTAEELACFDVLPDIFQLNFKNEIEWTAITKASYQRQFKQIISEIREGNFYQLNLTCPFIGNFTGENKFALSMLNQLFHAPKEQLGAMAHATYLSPLQYSLISNSPELHFQIKKNKIQCAPIKGSFALKSQDAIQKEKAMKEMSQSKKEQAELFMIADLITHELNSLPGPRAKVVKKKHFFSVPGILHQCSLIEKNIEGTSLTWEQLIRATFPCGSITGAPKKAVMQSTKDIENYHRGFYCGGTLLSGPKQSKMSVNIRTAAIDEGKKEIFYGAGGAITYQSRDEDEWKEIFIKLDSFCRVIEGGSTKT
ncbi:MAG: chorismate-binding protein [Bacteriovoracaceae bacterium]|nr:chorismate-binding protein [Bacteriovoracaceae bacterium]